MDVIQTWLEGFASWEAFLIQLLLTAFLLVVGLLVGQLMYSLINRLAFAKKRKEKKTYHNIIRGGLFLVGGLLGAIVSIYLVWGSSPQAILEAKLFEISKEKEVRISNLLGAFMIFFLARLGIYYFKRFFVRTGEGRRLPLDQGRRIAIFQIGRYIVYLLAILLILTSLNINLSVLVASSAALFVGIGLALQNTFSDIAAGIVILIDRTIEVGDMVVIDSVNLEGKVREIRLRSTVVETLDSMTVIVPNSRFTTTNVINWSFNDRETRFRVKVGVAYGSNVTVVRKLMVQAAKEHGLILKKPEPRVRFTAFGESSLDFELLFWTIRVAEYEDIKSDLRFKIEADFRKQGVRIPFPQRDLHIVSDYRQDLEEQRPDPKKKSEEK